MKTGLTQLQARVALLVVHERASFRQVATVMEKDESTVRQHWHAAVSKYPRLERQRHCPRGRVRTHRLEAVA
ncbi:MAG TPA: hypothetical protein VGN72_06595 [Tepidisphaeraceae bacterium]|nr:hypothetical protein [Tepidisphaeraceae bacterium]